MFLRRIAALVGFAALVLLIVAPLETSSAQSPQGGPYAPGAGRSRPRILITPQPLLYRQCVERLQLQYRPSGPVLYPLTYCWWVRG
jgi:hypothetical protein